MLAGVATIAGQMLQASSNTPGTTPGLPWYSGRDGNGPIVRKQQKTGGAGNEGSSIITDTNIGCRHESSIAAGFRRTGSRGCLSDGPGRANGCSGHEQDTGIGRDISYSTALTRELIAYAEVRPDIVHTHSPFQGVYRQVLHIPVVYTKHNLVRIPNEAGIVPGRARSEG